jgi:flagellar hook-length control protein FliK
MDRAQRGLTTTGLAMAEAFANTNSGTNGEESGVEPERLNSRESALFKDRLFALAQQNSTSGNTPGFELKDFLARQSNLSTSISTDQLTNDVSLHAVKEPTASSRLSGSPLQAISPMLQMTSTLDQKGWSNEVGQRVMWMVNSDLQQAQLQLNPKHLGPMEVKITMTSDQQINVSFLTHSSHVKEALDQALPRMREVFDQGGLNLNDVTVQQESRNQNREQHHTSGQSPSEDSRLVDNVPEDANMAQIFQSQTVSSNIVDFYA